MRWFGGCQREDHASVCRSVCDAVNDPFVMTAWGKDNQVAGKVSHRAIALPYDSARSLLDMNVQERYPVTLSEGAIPNCSCIALVRLRQYRTAMTNSIELQ